jgi:HEPN domain-containing protein
MRIYKAEEGYKAEDLLQSAYDHYAAAQTLISGNVRTFDSGGYLLHLAVELLFKAWLLHEKGEFDGTHSLQSLRNQVCELEPKLSFTKIQNNTVEHLDGLYELRYPNRNNPTGIGSEDIEIANSLVDRVIKFLPESLYSKFVAIPENYKGGRILMKKPKSIPVDHKLIFNREKM